MKNHIRRLTFLLLLALTLPATAASNTITNGDSLAASCHLALTVLDKGLDTIPADEQTSTFVCMAYLRGVLDGTHHANNLSKLRFAQTTNASAPLADFNLYCIDWNMRYQDAARIILRYARQNLELATQPADKLVMKALQDAYPCPKN